MDMSKTKLTAGLVVVGLVVVFTLQNTEVVQVSFLLWTFSMSRVLLIFGLLVAGGLLGWLACSLSQRHAAQAKRGP